MHIYYSMEKKKKTWNVSFDLLPLEMRWGTDPLYYMWSYSICHLSWAPSARNVCEVGCRSGTSEDPPLSADDSRCQPLYVSIPIYILKVSCNERSLWLGQKRRRSAWWSAAQLTIGWFPHEIQQERRNQLASVPRASSLIGSSIFQSDAAVLFWGFFFFSKTEQTPSPSCFPEPVLYGRVWGEHLVKFTSRGRVCPGITPLEWKVIITCQFLTEDRLAHLTVWSLYDDSGWECTDPSVQLSPRLRSLSCTPGLSLVFSLP